MMKGLDMRVFHLGISNSYVGEMTTPSFRYGDFFIASAWLGGFGTIDAIWTCRGEWSQGLVTHYPSGSTSQFNHVIALIPAQTMVYD
eukprot:Gb_41777 [translate_table: standard]